MTNPKLTGTSNITKKTVSTGTQGDMIVLGEYLIRHQKDALNLTLSEFVISAEEDCILGFTNLGINHDDTSCLVSKKSMPVPLIKRSALYLIYSSTAADVTLAKYVIDNQHIKEIK